MTVRRVTARQLNDVLEMDHVIRVRTDGQVDDSPKNVWAPEVYVECIDDDAGSIAPGAEIQVWDGWDLMCGYSGQHGSKRTDPDMHPSEYIGGRMAEDILANPGLYVACEIAGLYPDTVSEDRIQELAVTPIGWVVAYKRDAEPSDQEWVDDLAEEIEQARVDHELAFPDESKGEHSGA